MSDGKPQIHLGLLVLLWSLVLPAQTQFAAGRMNYEGRLTDSSGNPVAGPVDLTVEIATQDGSCVLYSETHTILNLNDGFFSLNIGDGTVNYNPLSSMENVFENGVVHANATVANTTYCNVGGNLTVGATDRRVLRVTVNDGSTTETLADQVISAVPSALRADRATDAGTLNGIADSGFIKVDAINNVTQTHLTSLVNGGDAGSLHNHDAAYAKINSSSSMTFGPGETLGFGAFDNSGETSLTAGLGAGDAGKTWYNSDTKKIMYWDGSLAQAIGAGADGVGSTDSPNAGGDIGGSFGAGLTINNDAVNSNMILDGTVDTVDLADDSVTTSKIVDGAVSLAKVSASGALSGQFIRYNGTALEFYTPTDSDTTYTADGNGIELSGTVFGLELEDGSLVKGASGLKVGTIGSSQVTDDSLADADINSAAAITRSKLAAGTANMVLLNDGSGVMNESSSIDATELSYLNNVGKKEL